MQFNTVLKLGGLAFGVVQDEKVRELAGIIHKGAKRRGVYSQFTGGNSAGGANAQSSGNVGLGVGNAEPHPIPFAPSAKTTEKTSQKSKVPGIHLPPQVGFPSGALGKYMNAGNAQKMKQWAAEIGQYLISK
jgi:hypothetical protein